MKKRYFCSLCGFRGRTDIGFTKSNRTPHTKYHLRRSNFKKTVAWVEGHYLRMDSIGDSTHPIDAYRFRGPAPAAAPPATNETRNSMKQEMFHCPPPAAPPATPATPPAALAAATPPASPATRGAATADASTAIPPPATPPDTTYLADAPVTPFADSGDNHPGPSNLSPGQTVTTVGKMGKQRARKQPETAVDIMLRSNMELKELILTQTAKLSALSDEVLQLKQQQQQPQQQQPFRHPSRPAPHQQNASGSRSQGTNLELARHLLTRCETPQMFVDLPHPCCFEIVSIGPAIHLWCKCCREFDSQHNGWALPPTSRVDGKRRKKWTKVIYNAGQHIINQKANKHGGLFKLMFDEQDSARAITGTGSNLVCLPSYLAFVKTEVVEEIVY